MVARERAPEVEDTWRLVPFRLHVAADPEMPISSWACTGLAGCGALVVDRAAHRQHHDLAEAGAVRMSERIRELESEVKRLTKAKGQPHRGR